jgi:hypothetical protein
VVGVHRDLFLRRSLESKAQSDLPPMVHERSFALQHLRLPRPRRQIVQPIQLGDDQLGLVLATGIERPRQFGPIRLLAAFDLDELGHDFPCPAVEKIPDGLLLGFQAKPALALACGADTVVATLRALSWPAIALRLV